MPKKKRIETPDEQSKRFEAEVQRLVDAGELNLIEADAAMETLSNRLFRRSKNT